MNAVELSLAAHRLESICEEMGAVLQRCALSPNIKDRQDFSCALFDRHGELVAQAAHIPVHLGSMVYAMRDVVGMLDWHEGDIVVFNDPFLGGTHLPDITMVMPVFLRGACLGFAVSRAHHADVGGTTPGSMGIHRHLADEGCVIAPTHWYRAGEECPDLVAMFSKRMRSPDERMGDLQAQRAACALGRRRLLEWRGPELERVFERLLAVSEGYARAMLRDLPDGRYEFQDVLDDDGTGHGPLPIRASVCIDGECATVDFSGSAPASKGPMNCPLSVTAAAVYYAFRCLMPPHTPQTGAIFRPIQLRVPEPSLLCAPQGAAVAAGNVETSQRIVDVVLGALAQAIPERVAAAAQGTMNNVVFGGIDDDWVYYETLGGGMGAHGGGPGPDAVQCHMTNTRNTSIEVLEMHYPLRIVRYAIRRGSGGRGRFRGGHGLVREWEALRPSMVSLLSERRHSAPYGLLGGGSGRKGRNLLFDGKGWKELPAKVVLRLDPGQRIRIETPGGGGFGEHDGPTSR